MQRASSQVVENPGMLGGGEILPNIVNGGYDAQSGEFHLPTHPNRSRLVSMDLNQQPFFSAGA